VNIKSIFRLSLILALAAVPLSGFAQEGPGPWIFTFFGTEYTIPSAVAAQGNVQSSVEIGFYDASTDDSPDMAAEYYDTNSGATVNARAPSSLSPPTRAPTQTPLPSI
jgi:hypothetical protein